MNISFIIPTYNNSELLAKTLAGLASQDFHNLSWEVIVIDNNSEDNVHSVYHDFREKFPLSLVYQPKLPFTFALCRARNVGLSLAKGEWVASIDADTIPNHKYLTSIENAIKKYGNKSIIATGERIFVSTDNISSSEIMNDSRVLNTLPIVFSPSNYGLPQDRRLPGMLDLTEVEHPWDYMHGCNVIYRRDDALSVGGYNDQYDGQWGFEDIDFAYRMISQQGCSPTYIKNLHVFHQDLPISKINPNRNDKSANPNWARICTQIPGYLEYKVKKYKQFSKDIKV